MYGPTRTLTALLLPVLLAACEGWSGGTGPRPEIPTLSTADWLAAVDGGSNLVRNVQGELIELGYRPGPVDGVVGPRTRAAIRAFESAEGLPASGRPTPELLVQLQAEPR
jgi:peptidoglycan hydrolase-like protein with peptidoglycan-binding domain